MTAQVLKYDSFQWSATHPLAKTHELARGIVREILAFEFPRCFQATLNSTASGQRVLKMAPEELRLMTSAVLERLHYCEDRCRKLDAAMEEIDSRTTTPQETERSELWTIRMVEAAILEELLNLKAAGRDEFVKLAKLIALDDMPTTRKYPLKSFLNGIKRLEIPKADAEFRNALEELGRALLNVGMAENRACQRRLQLLLNRFSSSDPESPTEEEKKLSRAERLELTKPALVGAPDQLVALKQYLGILPKDDGRFVLIGNDRFALREDSPLQVEHELIGEALSENAAVRYDYYKEKLRVSKAGADMLRRKGAKLDDLIVAAAERVAHTKLADPGWEEAADWQTRNGVCETFDALLEAQPNPSRNTAFEVGLLLSAWPQTDVAWTTRFAKSIEDLKDLSAGERHVLHRLRARMVTVAPFGNPGALVNSLTKLIGDEMFFALVPGEAWADEVNLWLSEMPREKREKWVALLKHASRATGARPSAKWLAEAKTHIKAIGRAKLAETILRWLPLLNVSRTVKILEVERTLDGAIHDDNATVLRGLLWMTPELVSAEMIRAVGALTVSCYRKIPGVGPRCVKGGNAGVYALSQMNDPLAVGQLALLKVKVKFGTAQKEIEKAFVQAAERSGLPREELEEMSVPTYGLTEVGTGEEEFGDFIARVRVAGMDSVEVEWWRADGKNRKDGKNAKSGKVIKAAPAEVKKEFSKEWKELQGRVKDIEKMLPAQRERIDGLFLQERVWPVAVWRERYLDHPLVGTVARRLLWEFESIADWGSRNADSGKGISDLKFEISDSKAVPHPRPLPEGEGEDVQTQRPQREGAKKAGIWFEGRVVDLDLRAIELTENTRVRLWHPIGKPLEEVLAWRNWLEGQGIVQPFKQAHREIYLLTEAELRTGTYSNRFAAHIVKQHQFNALCAARGWKNSLRLMVDAEYAPPTLFLPKWGLRAEFWVEGVGEDYGADTTESGAYLRLATDQVRFYRIDAQQRIAHAAGGGYRPDYRAEDAEPMALVDVPALVFSEVMRDVDLFVGVASVGNDPTWSDGGPNGRFVEYWRDYSFGALNESAKTRRAVLERLVPKLKISGACSFTEKFLVVKGSLRTYKIHLGSGNILMEPNDQYLCIVPKQSADAAGGASVMLPFEGDRTLSVILSKAFLLAADDAIKDSSILSQIRGK